MTTGKALNGKPYEGNPHVRFDEGEAAPAATPRRGSLLYSEKIVCAVFAATALLSNACGAPYVVTVAKGDGEKVVDAALVAAIGASESLVKRGDGVLRSNAGLKDYAGVIRVEEGVFAVTENGSLGTAAGDTFVSSGATLLFDVKTSDSYTDEGETVHIAGSGAEGLGGALVNGGSAQNKMLCKGQLILEGDATVTRSETGARFDLRDSSLVMNGHLLSVEMRTRESAFGIARTRVLQPGNIVVRSGGMLIEGNSNAAWDGTDANVITVRRGARLRRQESNAIIPWRLVLEDGSYYDVLPDRYGFSRNDDYYRWDGPVEVGGWCLFAEQGGTRMLFEGPVSGTGPLYLAAGWLWLVNPSNSFSGQVYFNGQSQSTSLTGGVVVCSNGALPANSRGAKIRMGDLVFKTQDELDLPPVEFEGSGRIEGGKGVMASLRKTGDGRLDISGVFDVTGRTELAGGTIRLARAPIGNPGLVKSTLLASETGVGVWDMLWEKGGVTFADQGVRALGFDVMTGTGPSFWPSANTAVKYTGHLWNRGEEDVAWTFYSHVNSAARLKIDEKGYMVQYKATGPATWGPVTLTPGAHKVEMWVVCENNSAAGGIPEEGYPLGFGYDRDGSGTFAAMEDPGDGSLFTSDLMTRQDLDFSALRTRFGDLALSPGTVLDLNDREASAFVGALSGSGIVSNGTLRITGEWKIRPGDLLEVCNGDLAIEESATLDFGKIRDFPRGPDGVVIARVDGTANGLARFAVPAEGWTLSVCDTGEVVLRKTPVGLRFVVR